MEESPNYDNLFLIASVLIYLFSGFLIVASVMEFPFLFEGKKLSFLVEKYGKPTTKAIVIAFAVLIIIGISIRIYIDFF